MTDWYTIQIQQKSKNVSDKEIESTIRKFNNNFNMQSIESIKKSFPNERQLYHDCLQNHDLKSLINFNNERLNRNKFSNSTTKKIHELIAYFNKERIKDCAFSIPYMFESTMPNIWENQR